MPAGGLQSILWRELWNPQQRVQAEVWSSHLTLWLFIARPLCVLERVPAMTGSHLMKQGWYSWETVVIWRHTAAVFMICAIDIYFVPAVSWKFMKETCISMSPWGLIFSTPFAKNSSLWSLKNEKSYLLRFMLIQFYGCDCLVGAFSYFFYF